MFALFLARTSGRPIAEIMDMPSALFTLYQAAYRLQPWGERLTDTHFAHLSATVCNASGNFKTARQAKDFLLLKDTTPSGGLSKEARQFLKRRKKRG